MAAHGISGVATPWVLTQVKPYRKDDDMRIARPVLFVQTEEARP